MSNKMVALVTGAAKGTGRCIVLELAKNGFDIVGLDILFDPTNKKPGLFEVKERVEEFKREFLPIEGDISDLEAHEEIIKQVLDRFERVDVLVNNAGVAPEKRLDILNATPESYDGVLSINARGAFFLTQKIAKQMIKQVEEDAERKSCIIFISSISAYVSSPSRAEYCISKAALSMTARVFADRLAEYGINVYEVRPGIIQTDMTAPVREKYDKLIAEGLIPQKRWGFPEDVAKAVASLARGDFAYSTGLVVEVSGGMNIRHL
ncbi:MAG: 3-ketoacyl-ACP reductase [Candidatus Aminicenantes bacterium]|nr:3-ketoacyl-ACP reductase [Candidatus Aminicenantes bacterium]MDH5384565.1 3-ketoacyl-ACP reductase [Candidatus Aminicenantes bacterium]MDH5745307.1 3-ketoacyl-ACP reductase [Candidatus Aminicenantes bacterium]